VPLHPLYGVRCSPHVFRFRGHGCPWGARCAGCGGGAPRPRSRTISSRTPASKRAGVRVARYRSVAHLPASRPECRWPDIGRSYIWRQADRSAVARFRHPTSGGKRAGVGTTRVRSGQRGPGGCNDRRSGARSVAPDRRARHPQSPRPHPKAPALKAPALTFNPFQTFQARAHARRKPLISATLLSRAM
jgi:hypothetical protein